MKAFVRTLPILAAALLLAGIQLGCSLAGKDFYLTQLIMSAYYGIVAMGLCLVMGYAGQVSLGHGAFFALGGYASAFLTTRDMASAHGAGWSRALASMGVLSARPGLYGGELVTFSPCAAFLCALLLAAGVAVLIGWPALRLKGQYLAMATLGFGLIVYRVLLGTEALGAADGITSVPPWDMGLGIVVSERKAYRIVNFYFAWGLALLTLALLRNVVESRVGRALRSIHGGELAANTMGVNTAGYKLKAFVLSAVLAAAAGCFLTHFSRGIGPSEASALKSVRHVALVAAGGMANLWGTLAVSSTLNFLSLRGCFGTLDHAVFGVLLIAIVSLCPEGPLRPAGLWMRRMAGRMRRGAARAGPRPADTGAAPADPEEAARPAP